MRDMYLASFHPKWADLIMDGKKNLELRRIKPKFKENDIIIVYSANPVKAIIGKMQVNGVLPGRENLFELGGHCLNEDGFAKYLPKKKDLYGILLKKPRRFAHNLELEAIRRIDPKFHPPQGGYKLIDINHILFETLKGMVAGNVQQIFQ